MFFKRRNEQSENIQFIVWRCYSFHSFLSLALFVSHSHCKTSPSPVQSTTLTFEWGHHTAYMRIVWMQSNQPTMYNRSLQRWKKRSYVGIILCACTLSMHCLFAYVWEGERERGMGKRSEAKREWEHFPLAIVQAQISMRKWYQREIEKKSYTLTVGQTWEIERNRERSAQFVWSTRYWRFLIQRKLFPFGCSIVPTVEVHTRTHTHISMLHM